MTEIPIEGTDETISVHGDEVDGRYRLVAEFPDGDRVVMADATVQESVPDPALFVWVSDWHMASSDTEVGGNRIRPAQASEMVDHIVSLNPVGVLDTGDCKNEYGLSTGDELDNYAAIVREGLPWATASNGAPLPILPGNHDEVHDYYPVVAPTDWSLWDARMWSAPYRFTCDWAGPRVRFMAVHSYIRHAEPFLGFGVCDQAEIDWLAQNLGSLPTGWKAIVCSHFPADPAFGNEIRSELGGTALRAVLAANQSKIVAYLNGHRHQNMGNHVLSGIRHFNGPGVSHTWANDQGGYVRIMFDGISSLVFRYFKGRAPFDEFPSSVYTPVTVSL